MSQGWCSQLKPLFCSLLQSVAPPLVIFERHRRCCCCTSAFAKACQGGSIPKCADELLLAGAEEWTGVVAFRGLMRQWCRRVRKSSGHLLPCCRRTSLHGRSATPLHRARCAAPISECRKALVHVSHHQCQHPSDTRHVLTCNVRSRTPLRRDLTRTAVASQAPRLARRCQSNPPPSASCLMSKRSLKSVPRLW